MGGETTQPSLLSRVRDAADDAAWRDFDAKYRELILRYCRARGLQASDAEDVRQISMANLAKSLRAFEYSPQRGRFRSYLGQVVRSGVSRHFSRPETRAQALVLFLKRLFLFLLPSFTGAVDLIEIERRKEHV